MAEIIRHAGYAYLQAELSLKTMPHYRKSMVGAKKASMGIENGIEIHHYRPSYWPGDAITDHLEFALKRDGINLEILTAAISNIDIDELTDWIKASPGSKYRRKIWFICESFLSIQLDIDNRPANEKYENLLDPKLYYAGPSENCARYKIKKNMLGFKQFCPTVRRTKTLADYEKIDFRSLLEGIMNKYPSGVRQRAINYLFTRETKSSFAIEKIEPSHSKTSAFNEALSQASTEDFVSKEGFIALQSLILDRRFASKAYRLTNNYVHTGSSNTMHFIAPKHENINDLMHGLIDTHLSLSASDIHAIIHAAIISFGFVFLHPFEDGNGRTHRFLIHNILSMKNLTPSGMIFPISVAMNNNLETYYNALDRFSKPLCKLIDYELDDEGTLTINNDSLSFYNYIDFTHLAEALFELANITLEKDIINGVNYIVSFDNAMKSIEEIIDMPNKLATLLIKSCIDNGGDLSKRKRCAQFEKLTDEEISECVAAIKTHFKDYIAAS